MICLDTAVLIWGIQGTSHPHQRGMIRRTRKYLEHLAERNERILVPAPVLAEYLCGFEVAKQRAQQAVIEHRFRVAAFDQDAAAKFAELGYDSEPLKRIRQEHALQRQELKFDLQVIAIAIQSGAQKIITGDAAAFQKMAAGQITVEEVPDIAKQQQIQFPET
jgi:predicted nucleic acid-binding protein